MTARIRGKVQYWNKDRNFGFLTPEPGAVIDAAMMTQRGDVFLNHASLDQAGLSAPAIGDVFEFAIEVDSDNRPRACNLVIVERAQDVVERVGGGW